ncbi:MAG TPA: tetratricopeptide repeat protein [Bryobacteraceae bacterium]|jgi:tetratricopeptide (TPR) repeat protein|nr:tetratricopeptide repeat protein [Bryobacteraceae bacterium]
MTNETVSSRSVLGTLALVFLAIIALSGVDTFLARTERSENRAEAERLAAAGDFKGAIAIERENPHYWLALGEAQLAAGQLTDAEATLAELLRRDSTSGPANLTLARVLVKEGRIAEAVSAYHRAVYGHWDRDAEKNRVNVRFELVKLLAQQGSKEELLAELLPMLDVAPDDLEMRERLGHLFLVAGSAARAGEIFGDILRKHPQDANAYAGLGEAEFARGNYQTAKSDFQIASDLKPSDRAIRARLRLSTEVLALDPMRRGLGPEEQYRRSLKMLGLAAAAVGCSTSPLAIDAQEEAHKAMKERVAPARVSSAIEKNLNLAEELWKIRGQECKKPPAGEEEALRLVLARIAQ